MEATGIATEVTMASPHKQRHRHRDDGITTQVTNGITTETTASPHPEVLRKKTFLR
ncbi:hypothetical protein [uncultured Bacteroides sp.]|uniref:hypothetical protein n=1 Tax=uncultured Bacteroides sp. TaxID=162156 RepID=UPI00280BDC2D|nr:hypothetical protein [uncultured Bacteroides sp.]